MDESFMVHLGMHVGSEGTSGGRVLVERALPTLKHNSKLRNWVISNISPAKVINASNEILGEIQLGLWNNDAHSTIIEKCIKGLFYHHYGKILEANSSIKTHYFNSLPPEMIKMSAKWASNAVGEGDFVYKYTSASNGSSHMSVWLFQFFNSHWAGGQTVTQLESKNA